MTNNLIFMRGALLSVAFSKRFVVITGSVALTIAVTTTLAWMGIIAIAAPIFDHATLGAARGSEVRELVERAKYVPISTEVLDANPKLREVIEGADKNYEAISRGSSRLSVYSVGITEAELNALISSLPEVNPKQAVHTEGYVSDYRYLKLEYDGKYYFVTITNVGKL